MRAMIPQYLTQLTHALGEMLSMNETTLQWLRYHLATSAEKSIQELTV